ncbi:MAG: CopD family protein [Rhodospirillales bacterium]|nr:CopD family protein [Rhodospirillales bacterium]MDE2575091.1 CopD family protein [Rhodospirillales bacterium]
MMAGILLALHVLGAVVWVGGMAFALLVLRPSLAVLEPAQRLALHGQVFRRFFLIVWHAMPVMLITGYAMVTMVYGGFAHLPWPVNAMQLLGLLMAAIFVFIFFAPWKALRAALAGGEAPAAAAAIARIRGLIQINLTLGIVTIVLAAFG